MELAALCPHCCCVINTQIILTFSKEHPVLNDIIWLNCCGLQALNDNDTANWSNDFLTPLLPHWQGWVCGYSYSELIISCE